MVRVKNRYLVVNFLYPEPLAKNKTQQLPHVVQMHSPTPDALKQGIIIRMIRDGVEDLFGDYGSGMVASGLKGICQVCIPYYWLLTNNHWPSVNYYSPSTSTAIIRCPRDHYEMVWAALTYITHLPKPINIPVVVRVVRVSGTIRKAEEEVIRRSQHIVKRAKAWDGAGELPMLQSVAKSVDNQRKSESEVLAAVDDGSESEGMSE
ncbi:Rpp14 family family [Pyrenophora tritici-repentis Pt-1C-BFP]|uniref:Ribonuclease P/MRP protein subunit POP5 n=1 Tax=Pyrenophora tritici-repentis (strain Pt-1C-BFP) TaxID=426418 RepID=B2WG45_PYRTR|nr:Rpp14 family [Pyrenophora tritici-repentis Pt-1C-BFP]EDU41952.1 Rpp14 family family [Pyrenophora tritici-repentis Pt-1C-BFP]